VVPRNDVLITRGGDGWSGVPEYVNPPGMGVVADDVLTDLTGWALRAGPANNMHLRLTGWYFGGGGRNDTTPGAGGNGQLLRQAPGPTQTGPDPNLFLIQCRLTGVGAQAFFTLL